MADQTKLQDTVASLSDFTVPAYDALPEIALYMDQVTGYLNKLLCRICRSEDGMPLTAGRINNYVKGGHITRPTQKKYDREQIAMLYMLCCIKQNLSIPEASALLRLYEADSCAALYEKFRTAQENTVRTVAGELSAANSEDALREKALELILRSTAERYLAEEIIAALAEVPAEEAPKEKKSKKEKNK